MNTREKTLLRTLAQVVEALLRHSDPLTRSVYAPLLDQATNDVVNPAPLTLRTVEDIMEEHRKRNRTMRFQRGPLPLNVACPTCGKEMVDESPGSFLASNPPQIRAYCPDGHAVFLPYWVSKEAPRHGRDDLPEY